MADDEQDEAVRKLETACREARHTMDQQIEKIHKEDQKAVGIFRLNLLVLGILASALSLSVRVDTISSSNFLNAHSVIGALALLFSSVVAAMAYTSSQFHLGVDPSRVKSAATDNGSYGDFYTRLNDEYSGWVEHNNHVHQFNAYAITWAMIFAITGVVFLTNGIVVGTLQIRGETISYLLLAGSAVLSFVLGAIVYYSDRVFSVLSPEG